MRCFIVFQLEPCNQVSQVGAHFRQVLGGFWERRTLIESYALSMQFRREATPSLPTLQMTPPRPSRSEIPRSLC